MTSRLAALAGQLTEAAGSRWGDPKKSEKITRAAPAFAADWKRIVERAQPGWGPTPKLVPAWTGLGYGGAKVLHLPYTTDKLPPDWRAVSSAMKRKVESKGLKVLAMFPKGAGHYPYDKEGENWSMVVVDPKAYKPNALGFQDELRDFGGVQ